MAIEKYKILLIEENSGDYLLIRECLDRLNYEVSITWLRTASEANNYINSFCESTDPPQLILSELIIPGADVCDLLKLIKPNKLLCDLPFIVFTNGQYLDDLLQSQNNGATAVFSKPHDFHLYAETIRQIFEIVKPQTNILLN